MTDTVKRWWLDMTEHQLINHLTVKMKYPQPLVADIVAKVGKAKTERRTSRIRETQVKRQWAKVLDPARTELKTVRVMKRQTQQAEPVDDAKWNALCHYEAVLVGVIARIRHEMYDEDENLLTPNQVIAQRKAAGKNFIPPNNGEHWTDWVLRSERKAVYDSFNQVKQPKRGKAKEPFARVIPRKQYKAQRGALVERLQIDLAQAEQEYELATDPEEQERLNDLIQRMHQANYLIDKLAPNAPLPKSWQDLLEKLQ